MIMPTPWIMTSSVNNNNIGPMMPAPMTVNMNKRNFIPKTVEIIMSAARPMRMGNAFFRRQNRRYRHRILNINPAKPAAIAGKIQNGYLPRRAQAQEFLGNIKIHHQRRGTIHACIIGISPGAAQ